MTLAPTFTLSPADQARFRLGQHLIADDAATFRFEGSGAHSVLQGILTNDISHLNTRSAIWGALLTPKGMIIADVWVTRDETGFWLVAPTRAHEALVDLWKRSVPPRLARVTDATSTTRVEWLIGTAALPDDPSMFRPASIAPFAALVIRPTTASLQSLATWIAAPSSFADLAKVQLGWPTLGREIDEKTLPQEVRFDELEGVRYDKGCFTGQETVARLHFRGHANRVLRGVSWAPGEAPTDRDVSDGAKSVGTLRTIARLGDRVVALAVLRREIQPGDTVRTGDTEGVVVALPFEWSDLIPG